MSFLTRRSALLAAVEATFRTDQVPSPTAISHSAIDSTSDVDNNADEIDITSHGFQTGDGPVQVTIEGSALPTPLTEDTDYWIIRGPVGGDNGVQLAASLSDAAAGTAIGLTVAVGTFTLAMTQSDGFLVEEPDFAPDVTVLERNNSRVTLSPEPGIVARKIATVTFAHEIRNNGVIDGTLSPRTGVLLRGCGMQQVLYGETGNEEETILDDTIIPINAPDGTFTYTKTTGFGGTLPRVVILECTTPGGTGVADFNVFSPAVGAQAEVSLTAQLMTDATAFQLVNDTPSADAEITPTITADFAVGDTYVINLAPAGHFYEPISESFDSLSMYLYFGDTSGAILHRLTGARGTFEAAGEAADFGRFNFTFTGDYNDPTDSTLPATVDFESTLPPQIELANLVALGGVDFDATAPLGTNLCAQAFSIDIANNVVPRACINDADSLAGAIITGRSPVGSFNPETELEATHPFWANLGDGERVFWNVRVGSVQGNVVTFTAKHAQYTEIAYGDRDGIRTYEVNTALKTLDEDDELRIVFS